MPGPYGLGPGRSGSNQIPRHQEFGESSRLFFAFPPCRTNPARPIVTIGPMPPARHFRLPRSCRKPICRCRGHSVTGLTNRRPASAPCRVLTLTWSPPASDGGCTGAPVEPFRPSLRPTESAWNVNRVQDMKVRRTFQHWVRAQAPEGRKKVAHGVSRGTCGDEPSPGTGRKTFLAERPSVPFRGSGRNWADARLAPRAAMFRPPG